MCLLLRHLLQSLMCCVLKKCSYADLGCSKWLFELVLPFYQLKTVWLFSLTIGIN